MGNKCVVFLLFVYGLSNSQEIAQDSLDTKYREDQFYASISYNILVNDPMNFKQNGISTGFNVGFIRDIGEWR